MFANDIKKGTQIRLTGGRYGTMQDNKKGTIRFIEVKNGVFGPELGSCYISEIVGVLNPATGEWEGIQFTPAQTKQLGYIKSSGF